MDQLNNVEEAAPVNYSVMGFHWLAQAVDGINILEKTIAETAQ
jgi:hypothetical protein